MNKNTTSYSILSLTGLIFLILLYLYSDDTINPFRIIFLFIFIIICILGIVASIYPSYCLRFLSIETTSPSECENRIINYEGHHPDCGVFNDHVFNFKNRKYCVGCSGLLTGALLAILSCLYYLFYGTEGLIFWLGVILVLASLLQLIFFSMENKWVKFLSNLGLVWGSSLIMIGLLEHSNVFIAVYFLFLIIAWIITRTALSQENHDVICDNCPDLNS
ncbi:MAG: hypothetical protein LLF83_00965 [Methanobacterium sp.]|nr:hypothetical protein [Methanobacterium sp.]